MSALPSMGLASGIRKDPDGRRPLGAPAPPASRGGILNPMESVMPSHDLVTVVTAEIGDRTVNAVNARDLHAFLEVGRDFSNWIENNLFSQFRIPYIGDRRKAVSKYGKYYRAGMITPCPFTGYCFDEELIDALKERILKGDTIRGAFEYLAYVASKAIEREWEEQLSEPYFADHADANNFEFTIDGHFWKGV